MTVVSVTADVTKNQGLKLEGVPFIRLKDTRWETVQMKTKTKEAWVDTNIVDVPRDDCFCRLDNWRRLLKAPAEKKRPVRLIQTEDGAVVRLDVWVRQDDPQVWDSEPLNWKGEGWVPFYLSLRPRGIVKAKNRPDDADVA